MQYNDFQGGQGQWFNQQQQVPALQYNGFNKMNTYNPQQFYNMPQMNGYQPAQSKDDLQYHGQPQLKMELGSRKNMRPVSAKVVQKKGQSTLKGSSINVNSLSGFSNTKVAVPRNISIFNKEQLYEEALGLKIEKNNTAKENTILKTQMRTLEKELKRKDQVIKQLLDQQVYDTQTPGSNTSSMQAMQTQAERNLNLKYKSKLRQLKNELILKSEELQTMSRSIKFTKITELELTIEALEVEGKRLKHLVIEEMNKPRIDPYQFQRLSEDFQQAQFVIKNIQQEASQLASLIQDKETTISKRDKKLGLLHDRLKNIKDKHKNQAKKIKVLKAKILDLEKKLVMNISNGGPNKRLSGQMSTQSQSSRKNSPAKSSMKVNNQADWFEKYIIEKTKNDRILKKLSIMGHPIDVNEAYSDEELDDKPIIPTEQSEQSAVTYTVIFNQEKYSITFPALNTMKDLVSTLRQQLGEEQFTIKINGDIELKSLDQLKALPQDQVVLVVEQDYGGENFETYEENMIDAVTKVDINDVVKEVKFKLQIKRVTQEKAFKYIMTGLKEQDGKRLKSVTLKQFKTQLMKRLRLNEEEALYLSRYLIETPNESGQVVYNEEAVAKRSQVKERFLQLIGQYQVYNGFAMTKMLNRVTTILEDKRSEIEEALRNADDDGEGEVPLSHFYEILLDLDIPKLDEEIQDFLEYMVFRQTDSTTKINYYAFLEIFDEDYLIDKSPYEDPQEFQPSPETSADEAEGPQADNEEEMEIDEEDLMLIVDHIHQQIVDCFPQNKKLLSQLFPLIKPLMNSQAVDNKQVLFIMANDYVKFLREVLKIPLSDREMQCMLHIMIREDLQGVILYDELKSMLKNYLRKEALIKKCISQNLRYDLIRTKETLDFLSRMKQLTANGQTLTELLQPCIINQTIVDRSRDQSVVQVMDFETLLDHLFMKYQLKCPPVAAQQELRKLLSIDDKYPEVIMLKKLERVMIDYEQIYVNLLKMTKDVTYAKRYSQYAPVIQKSAPQQQPRAVEQATNKQPTKKKGVQFEQEPQPKQQKQEDFTYDQYRKKYTAKAEVIPDDSELDEEMKDSFKTDSRVSEVSDAKPKNQKQPLQQPKKKLTEITDQDEDVEDHTQFQYDQFRKKYTVKAEMIDEDSDLIEDNYE